MAHKGRLYPIRQSSRPLAGDVPWPRFPAKSYEIEGEVQIDALGVFDVTGVILEPFNDTVWEQLSDWRSEVIDLGGAAIRLGVRLWSPGIFTMPDQVHQLWFEDEQQYEWIAENVFQSDTWQFITTQAELQVPTAGAVARYIGIVQSNAVPW